MQRRALHRRLLTPGLLRLGYRIAAVAAHAWWWLRGSENRGAKCVLFNDREVLLVRHTYGDRRAWEFPGGFIRRREQPRTAARRELREELGVDPPDLRYLGPMSVEIGRRKDTIHYFGGRLTDRRLSPDDVELAEIGWFDPRSLPRRLGEHVVEMLDRLASSDLAAATGQVAPEPVASFETDPGSPIRG